MENRGKTFHECCLDGNEIWVPDYNSLRHSSMRLNMIEDLGVDAILLSDEITLTQTTNNGKHKLTPRRRRNCAECQINAF